MKTIYITIDGIRYPVLNVLNKPGDRIIIRAKRTIGVVLPGGIGNIYHICYEKDGESVSVKAILLSLSNDEKTEHMELKITDEDEASDE